ncbi:hypothetical protein DYB37_007975, partial [Aphanomyces astaci]
AWKPQPTLLFSTFLRHAAENNVRQVSLASDFFLVHACMSSTTDCSTSHFSIAQVSLKQGMQNGVVTYRILVPPLTDQSYILDILRKHGVEFGTMRPSWLKRSLPMLLTAIPLIYLALTYRMLQGLVGGGGGKDGVAKDGITRGKLKSSSTQQRISFADIAGIDNAKLELEEIVDFLKHPTRYDAIGAKMPKVLDPALLRPGRFDRHVFVGLPDAAGREAILRVHTKRIRLDASVSLAALAGHPQLEGASGAALACLVNEAALMAVRTNDTVAKMKHFELAVARAAASATSDIQYQ